MPAAISGSVSDKILRRWLARGDLEMQENQQEPLSSLLELIGHPPVNGGMAALRFWGQTGDRPRQWIAAADPVHLEAMLDHLRLHSLWNSEWQDGELRQLFEELETSLAEEGRVGFIRIGASGYLRGDVSMPTAPLSPQTLNGCEPTNSLPSGPSAAVYHNLLSEIQMTLHRSSVNTRRVEQGMRAINSLWIWGGGTVPESRPLRIPALFADDPLFCGYWNSCDGVTEPWQGGLEGCVDRAPHGFVAITPDTASSSEELSHSLNAYLLELRRIIKNSDIRRMTLFFRNGLTARMSPRQVFRIWRRDTPFFGGGLAE